MQENKLQQYIDDVRKIEGLKNAILIGICISKRELSAEFSIVTNTAYPPTAEVQLLRVTQGYLPTLFKAKTKIIKRVPDEEKVRAQIVSFMCKRFPAAAAFLEEGDVHVQMLDNGANFYFDVPSGEQSLFSSGEILDEVSAYLSSGYCGAFYGNVRIVEREREEISLDDYTPPEEEKIYIPETRYFPIVDYVKIDGVDEPLKKAVYMADFGSQKEPYAVCGKITYIEEKEYVRHNDKTGEDEQRSRFSVTVSDGSGTIRTTYFPKKATLEKVRSLKQGDSIVISGQNELYNDRLSFKASKINYGTPPEGFVPEEKKGRPAPDKYHTVFPKKYVDYTQQNLFTKKEIPAQLIGKTFVVFDLETTGLNSQPSMGKMDKIIEVGAAKVVDGEIVETFSSLVCCSEKLAPKIIELTGIKDEDLIGQPPIEEVIADFYKFADGAYLVGHNVAFDYGFIRYYGEQNEYVFEHKRLDTIALAQEVLRGELNNFKLNTIADYYGFEFNHHRAYEDAVTTAKVMIELVADGATLNL